ncbi:hypothetical protein VTN49DRAFT_7326 [Thermomyces lanuginosus]|uniref:uncharacterized protein n=1 Tax=Thermomyces lanuginosus TaxID=5541 RepID=UPI00374343B4
MSHELHCSTHDGIGAEEEESSKHQHLNGFCGNESKLESLLTACSRSDHGGGVSFASGRFAIYSTAVKPSSSLRTWDNDHRLHDAARAVAAGLPVYTAWHEIPTDSGEARLISLPRGGGGGGQGGTQPAVQSKNESILSCRPWFLLNAARSRSHCIVGRGDRVQTLLTTLQRPWCVLELCCIDDTDVLAAVLEFAVQAQRVVPGCLYDSAVYLLRWEVEKRRQEYLRLRRRSALRNNTRELYTVCDAVFPPSAASFNGFWIRMICVCAVEMGVPFSTVVQLLNGMKKNSVEAFSGGSYLDERHRGSSEVGHLTAVYARALGKVADLVA